MQTRAALEPARRVSDCVGALLRDQPFFGSLALRLPIRPDPTRQTLASDGREIRYAPDWVARTDADLIKTALARVVLACALKHHTRRGERDPERWQYASQLVTHGLLRDSGFILPPDAEALDGISVEEAYDRLPEPQPDPDGSPEPSPPEPSSSAGASDDGTTDTPSDPTPDDDADPGSGNVKEDPEDDGRDGTDTGADNHNPPPEPPPGDPSDDRPGDSPGSNADSHDPAGTGEVMDAPFSAGGGQPGPAAPPGTIDEEQSWDEAMHQALSLAKAQGREPGSVKEVIQGAHVSVLDWRALMRRFMTDAARSDYSWSLPNRRFIDSGLYLPSIHSEGIETIAVIVDTSGSLPARILADFWAEIREIANEIRPETVLLLQVDAAVQEAIEYAPHELPDEIAIKGRGGTDFRPGFQWIEDNAVRPAVCVYLTDMECSSYPISEPDYPVLWVNFGDPPEDWNREPWGELIQIPPIHPR